MFSGIIDCIGEVVEAGAVPGGMRLRVRAPGYWTGVALGASIAIDGVCLTATTTSGDIATFDVVAETLRRTTLGTLRAGGRVNLQKSLKAGDPIDGHFVQGHVDAIARVERVEQSPAESMWWFALDADAMRYVIPKGSIAIDGISLTVANRRDDCFSVALIPTTLERTTLGDKQVGARVNIETDLLSRTIVHHLQTIAGDDPQAFVERLRRSGQA